MESPDERRDSRGRIARAVRLDDDVMHQAALLDGSSTLAIRLCGSMMKGSPHRRLSVRRQLLRGLVRVSQG
jgi:hypothetical protein